MARWGGKTQASMQSSGAKAVLVNGTTHTHTHTEKKKERERERENIGRE